MDIMKHFGPPRINCCEKCVMSDAKHFFESAQEWQCEHIKETRAEKGDEG